MGLIALTAKVVAVVALYMSLMLGVAFAQAKLPWQTDSLLTLSAEDEDITLRLYNHLKARLDE